MAKAKKTDIQKLDEAILRLNKDLKVRAKKMTKSEIRFLVDSYYGIQDYRIQLQGQLRAADQKVDDQPCEVLTWMFQNMKRLESQVKLAFQQYVEEQELWQDWLKDVQGIGPVLAAGLFAHIDIEKCPTVGHIWAYAGYDPTKRWIGSSAADIMHKYKISNKSTKKLTKVSASECIGALAAAIGITKDRLYEWIDNATNAADKKLPLCGVSIYRAASRRPWNARFKTLCWKIGKSFVFVQGKEEDNYGRIFVARCAYETAKNEAGDYADQAAAKLKKFNIGKNTDAYKAYSKGKLPKGHLRARARRYAVKLFLSHFHELCYEKHYGKPAPAPYPIAILGHAHKLERKVAK